MSYIEKYNEIYKNSKVLNIDESSRIIFFSDCHRGDGTWADDFMMNKLIYKTALNYYYKQGYTYIEIGDGDELWKNRSFNEIYKCHQDVFDILYDFYSSNRLYMIFGNHDIIKKRRSFCSRKCKSKRGSFLYKMKMHEGLVLKDTSSKSTLFVVHGHQGDLLNDHLWPLTCLFVRFIIRPLGLFGVKNPTSPAINQRSKDKAEHRFYDWINRSGHVLIAGHTHRAVFSYPGTKPYFNDGSCVSRDGISGIEICNGEISLIMWLLKSRDDGTLYITRKTIAGPEKISHYTQK